MTTQSSDSRLIYRVGVNDGEIVCGTTACGYFETADRGAVVFKAKHYRCFAQGAPQGNEISLREDIPGSAGRNRDPETGRLINTTPQGREIALLAFDWREGRTDLRSPDGLMFHLVDGQLFSAETAYGGIVRRDDVVQVTLDREVPESEHAALVILLVYNYLLGNNLGFLQTPTGRRWLCT
jgi:hypothetical protein